MTRPLFVNPFLVGINLDGTIESGAKLYFYQTGTSTLATIYDSAGASISNPVVADSNGRFADVYLGTTGQEYRVRLMDSSDVLITDVDPYTSQDITTTLALTTGSTLIGYIDDSSGATAQTVSGVIRQSGEIYPEQFGAVGDGTTNDYTALQAWLNAITAGKVGVLGPRTYKFNTALSRTDGVDDIHIRGEGNRSCLLYGGGSTTNNLITIGSLVTGTSGTYLENFRIESNTTMTAGAALKLYTTYHSRCHNITYGGQYGNNKIFNGLDIEVGNSVYIDGFDIYGIGTGMVITDNRSTPATTSGNIQIMNGKIASMGQRGIWISGGVNGVNIMNADIRQCGTVTTRSGITVDDQTCASQNDNIMIGPGVLSIGHSGHGVTINDTRSTNSSFHLNGVIAESNLINGLFVEECNTSTVVVTGGSFSHNTTNGIRNTEATGKIVVTGASIRSNGAWGINSVGAGGEVQAIGCQFASNVSGTMDGGVAGILYNSASAQWEFSIADTLIGHVNAATGFVDD